MSRKILRGEKYKDLEKVNLNQIGPKVSSRVDKLYQSLSNYVPKPVEKELTAEEKVLIEWEAKLKEREQNISALEQQTIEQATQIGQQRGYEAGWEKAEHERVTLHQAAESLKEEFETFKTELAEKILNLSCLIAKQTIGDTIELNDEVAISSFRKLFDSMELTPEKVTLMAHPHTLEILKNQFGADTELKTIRLKPDSSQMKGGFILKHPEGEVNANMELRWHRVLRHLDQDVHLSQQESSSNEQENADPNTKSNDTHDSEQNHE